MFKKTLAVILAALIVQMVCVQSAAANSREEKQARLIEKVKTGIAKLGVGQEARVEVKLQDKTRLAGYISEAKSDSFVVTNAKTGNTTSVAYSEVTQVRGLNSSTGSKIGIGIGIGVGAILVLILLMRANVIHYSS